MRTTNLTLICFWLLIGLAHAQPRLSVEYDATVPATGVFRAGGPADLIQSGEVWTARVWPILPAKRITVTVGRTLTSSIHGEHLGMRVDWTKAPAGYAFHADDFPGELQQPYVIGHEDAGTTARSFILLPLDWPVRAAATRTGATLTWIDPPVNAGQSSIFRFVYLEDSGPGGERARGLRLAARMRPYMPAWTAPAELANSHGLFAFMGQDTADPAPAFASLWAEHGRKFAGAILWGPMSDLGGSCCTPSLGLHARYALLPGLSKGATWPVWGYARPQSREGGPVDPDWWLRVVAATQSRFRGVYGDVVGFTDLAADLIPQDCIIEGARLGPWPTLVSNAMSGGGFAFGAGGLPLTLPDGTSEPRSTKPWLTSALWIGRSMMDGRVMLIGDQNYDYYFSGLYIAPDGRRFQDALQQFALAYDLPIAPRAMTAGWQSVISERNRIGWLEQDREFIEPGLWLDRRTGKRWRVAKDAIRIEEVP